MRKHNYPTRIYCPLQTSTELWSHVPAFQKIVGNMIRDLVVSLSLGELDEAKQAWPKGEPEGQAE
jgi:hypothetical protein